MCDKDKALIPVDVDKLVQLSAATQVTAEQLTGIVQQLGGYLIQLDARMRKQEELLQRRVTVSSAQYKQVMAAIRRRAVELCGKYQLPMSAGTPLRAAIKRDVLERWHIKDLHDLPESALSEAMAGVGAWDSYSLVRKVRREMEEEE